MKRPNSPNLHEWDLESEVESYFRKECIAANILVRKVKWIGRHGAPDRLLLAEDGRMVWCEIKRPGGVATFPKDARERAQAREHKLLHERGQRVVLIDSREAIDALVLELSVESLV